MFASRLKRVAVALCLLLPTSAVAAFGETYVWRNAAIGGGGYVPSVVFSPAEKGLAYLRTDMGGLYRWDNHGRTWIPLMDKLGGMGSYMGIESVAPDPRDPNAVYAAVGTYRAQQAAILRSNDRGAHWDIVNVPFHMGANENGRAAGERLAVDPNDTTILYFGSRWDGLQVSTDKGKTWSKARSFPPGTGYFVNAKGEPDYAKPVSNGVAFVVFDPTSGQPGEKSRTLFAALSDPGDRHLYRSDDAGASWHPVKGEPTADLLPVHGAIVGGVLYLTYCTGSTGPFQPYGAIKSGAVYKYDIKSGRWTDITPQKTAPDATGGYGGLAVDPHHPGTVMVGTTERWVPGDTVWRSIDDGKTWQDVKASSKLDVSETPYLKWGNAEPKFGWWISCVAIDPFEPTHVAYTTGATVYATQDIGKPSLAWRPWTEGMEETAVLAMTSPPAGPQLLSALGDIGGFVHEDLTKSPAAMMTNPVFANTNVVDYAGQAPNVMVRAGIPANKGVDPGLAYSLDSGRSWSPLKVPPLKGVNAQGQQEVKRYDLSGDISIAVSADGKTIIVMTPIPLITRDYGKTWLPARGLPLWGRVVADRVNPNRFYAVDLSVPQLLSSTDGGATFTPIGKRLYGNIIYKWATKPDEAWPLMATPGVEGDLWIRTGSNELYHSTDGGENFKFVDGHLGVEALAFGKSMPSHEYPTLFAYGWNSPERRIFRSTDKGKTWQCISDADHQYGWTFMSIAGDPRVFGRVYIGTNGRGIVYGEPSE
jgi:xyloglucan-specific exo-beta-1,4-glucanase